MPKAFIYKLQSSDDLLLLNYIRQNRSDESKNASTQSLAGLADSSRSSRNSQEPFVAVRLSCSENDINDIVKDYRLDPNRLTTVTFTKRLSESYPVILLRPSSGLSPAFSRREDRAHSLHTVPSIDIRRNNTDTTTRTR